ncbi:MAG TPA: metallophosphoesterase [Anaerohalosphaeraceae bacterium]|jgi:predicted MPP superfamily phosphohydrolase|nr:metallophosphoesterase [Anaerohalosphaeraceae bacterium]HRT85971.1 metallophosphoesterase [Anaerohalosphaeraceae bacterium]
MAIFLGELMRAISEKRQLVESKRRVHRIRRGRRGWLHFENMPWLEGVFKAMVRAAGLRRRGWRNAAAVELRSEEFAFADLPAGFDGLRILFVTDTHIDEFPALGDTIRRLAESVTYDFCILGGDYNFGYRQESGMAYLRMKELAEALVRRSPVYGVLGNHDRYAIGRMLEECGVHMLVNEHVCLERDGGRLCLVGLDDCHYYESADVAAAEEGMPAGAFKVFVCHSPEMYRHAAEAGYALYLAGHTHGGQVCLPGGVAVVTCATVPRRMLRGKWRYGRMVGYTSRGSGASGVAVRFFCPPEITVITLRRRVD